MVMVSQPSRRRVQGRSPHNSKNGDRSIFWTAQPERGQRVQRGQIYFFLAAAAGVSARDLFLIIAGICAVLYLT